MRINVHVPITLRIVGAPTDDHLAAIGAAVTRLVRARPAEADRVLGRRHGVASPPPDRPAPEVDQAPRFLLASRPDTAPTPTPAPAAAPPRRLSFEDRLTIEAFLLLDLLRPAAGPASSTAPGCPTTRGATTIPTT